MSFQNSDTDDLSKPADSKNSSSLQILARVVFWIPVFTILLCVLNFSLSVHGFFHLNDFLFDIILFNIIPLFLLTSILLGISVGIIAKKRDVSVGKYTGTGIALSFPMLCAVLLFATPLISRPIAARIMCQQNMTELGIAMKHYVKTHDGRLPDAEQWCAALLQDSNLPESRFTCPYVRHEGVRSNYAMNNNLSGMALSNVNPKTVLLFDSKPGWNQSGGLESLTTANHLGVFRFNLPRVPGCVVLFADSSVAYIDKKRISELRWNP